MQIACSLISKASSFRAINRALRFSAWARCGSNLSSREVNTQYRISASRMERIRDVNKIHEQVLSIMAFWSSAKNLNTDCAQNGDLGKYCFSCSTGTNKNLNMVK